jgi:hypothetical protein
MCVPSVDQLSNLRSALLKLVIKFYCLAIISKNNKKILRKKGPEQPCYFTKSYRERMWLTIYNHRKSRERQLYIL